MSTYKLGAAPIERDGEASAWPISFQAIGPIALLLDVVLIFASSIVAGLAYHRLVLGGPGDVVRFAGAATIVTALFVPLAHARSLYQPVRLRERYRQIKAIIPLWAGAFLVLSFALFSLKISTYVSRGSVLSFAVLGFVALVASRVFWRAFLIRATTSGALRGRTAIVIGGDGERLGFGLSETLGRGGFRVARRFPLRAADEEGLRRTLDEAAAYVRGSDVEEILILADVGQLPAVGTVVEHFRNVPLPVRLLPHRDLARIVARTAEPLGNTVAIELQRAPLTGTERALKRGLDLVVAGIGVVVLIPVLTIVALAVKLDSPGPVLFRQTRQGFNGRQFKILKFRSMTVLEDGGVVRQASRHDARVTRVGRWIRRTSIDELPQLFNVLRGDMSIVGPRPHAVAHDSYYDKLIGNYAFRHHMKPGITGWAQVSGFRGETPTLDLMERRVELDVWYVDNWSLLFDVRIILKTAVELLRSRNVY